MLVTVIKLLITLLLVLGLAPLCEGFMRKLRAIVHSRQGPPLRQPYLDILKLLSKEELQPTSNPIYRLAPFLCFAAVLTSSLFVPLGYTPLLHGSGYIIAFIYLITLSSTAIFLGGLASGNPFASIGASRELMLLFTVEPILAVTLIVTAVKSNTLILSQLPVNLPSLSTVIAAAAFFLAMQVQMGKLPFDIVEADQEIMEGPFIEYSGPGLALFKWSFYMKEFIFSSLLWRVFINWPDFHRLFPGSLLADIFGLLSNLIEVFLILAVIALIDVVNPRLRIDQALRYYGTVAVVAVCGLALALLGA